MRSETICQSNVLATIMGVGGITEGATGTHWGRSWRSRGSRNVAKKKERWIVGYVVRE